MRRVAAKATLKDRGAVGVGVTVGGVEGTGRGGGDAGRSNADADRGLQGTGFLREKFLSGGSPRSNSSSSVLVATNSGPLLDAPGLIILN